MDRVKYLWIGEGIARAKILYNLPGHVSASQVREASRVLSGTSGTLYRVIEIPEVVEDHRIPGNSL
jgi:hypothetical protein